MVPSLNLRRRVVEVMEILNSFISMLAKRKNRPKNHGAVTGAIDRCAVARAPASAVTVTTEVTCACWLKARTRDDAASSVSDFGLTEVEIAFREHLGRLTAWRR